VPAQVAGFTLIELLVAITLLGLLLATIFGGLRLGTRAWETGATRLEHSARLQVVQNFLRQRLSTILPLRADPGARPSFEGGPETLRFVAALPAHLGAGLHEFVLAVAEGESELPDLVVSWRRLVGADEPFEPPWQQRRLLAAIDGLSLAYWGSQELDQPADWHAEWVSPLGPPLLVRVAIGFAEEDPRHFPVLIARRMIDRIDAPQF
jgi:general secretion pathway protein J